MFRKQRVWICCLVLCLALISCGGQNDETVIIFDKFDDDLEALSAATKKLHALPSGYLYCTTTLTTASTDTQESETAGTERVTGFVKSKMGYEYFTLISDGSKMTSEKQVQGVFSCSTEWTKVTGASMSWPSDWSAFPSKNAAWDAPAGLLIMADLPGKDEVGELIVDEEGGLIVYTICTNDAFAERMKRNFTEEEEYTLMEPTEIQFWLNKTGQPVKYRASESGQWISQGETCRQTVTVEISLMAVNDPANTVARLEKDGWDWRQWDVITPDEVYGPKEFERTEIPASDRQGDQWAPVNRAIEALSRDLDGLLAENESWELAQEGAYPEIYADPLYEEPSTGMLFGFAREHDSDHTECSNVFIPVSVFFPGEAGETIAADRWQALFDVGYAISEYEGFQYYYYFSDNAIMLAPCDRAGNVRTEGRAMVKRP